ncbi:MAG: hypothetical protein P2A85_09035 [Microcoleus anatoxicus]|uniref:hypothetical protein n=1 Tax=Microcoleus anatoxicus TaxID=2705319 RepID=UPI00366A9E74
MASCKVAFLSAIAQNKPITQISPQLCYATERSKSNQCFEAIGTYINPKILAISNATYSLSLLIVCQIIVVVA